MTISNGYCTLAEFKDWSPRTGSGDDAKIERAVESASRAIDDHCNRVFYQSGGSRTFDTSDVSRVEIGDAVSVSAVAVDSDSDGVYETTWAATAYQVTRISPAATPEPWPFDLIVALDDNFPRVTRRRGLIQVTGVWGWPALPVRVKQACLIAANRLVKRKDSPEGIAQGFDEFGPIRISGREDPDVTRLLAPYRHAQIAIA